MNLPGDSLLDLVNVVKRQNPELLAMVLAQTESDFFGAQVAKALDHFIRGAFITEHKHSSEARVQILHLGCNLHVDDRT